MSQINKLEAKGFSFEVTHLVWSPKMDVIALANVRAEVSLHRLSWQKVWQISSPLSSAHCVLGLSWRLDGLILAIAYENCNEAILVNVENGNIVHKLSLPSDPYLIKWVGQTTYKSTPASNLQDKILDVTKSGLMPHLASLPLSLRSKCKLYQNDRLQNPIAIFSELPKTFLCISFKTCVVLYFQGIYPILKIPFSSEIENVLEISMSEDLSMLSLLYETSSNIETKLFATPIFHENVTEFEKISMQPLAIITCLEYIQLTISGMQEHYEDILLELSSKLVKFAETKSTEGSVADELIILLGWGRSSPELESFLVVNLGEKGVKKLKQNLQNTYSTLERLLSINLLSACRNMMFYLSELHALSLFKPKYGKFGYEPHLVQEVISAVGSFTLKANEMLNVIKYNINSFLLFFQWLHITVCRLNNDEPPSDISKMSLKDLHFVADFITEHLQETVRTETEEDGTTKQMFSFKLEKVGQYLLNEDLHVTFEKDPKQNLWNDLLEQHPEIFDSGIIFHPRPNNSLMQLFNVMSNSIQQFIDAAPLVVFENCIPQIPVRLISKSETSYNYRCRQLFRLDKTHVTCLVTESNKVVVFNQPINLKDSGKIAAAMFDLPSSHSSKMNYLDVEHLIFYDETTLSLILRNPSDQSYLICQLPFESFDEWKSVRCQSLKPCASLRQFKTFNPVHLKSISIKKGEVSFFDVSGTRKLSAVVHDRRRFVTFYDMEAEVDEESMDSSISCISLCNVPLSA